MELWTAFVLGLGGSLHCAGMCGPLVLAIPSGGRTARAALASRLVYHSGRMAIYAGLGAVAGVLSSGFSAAGLQRWISISAGLGILLGLFASAKLGLNRPAWKASAWLRSAFGALIQRRTLAAAFGLGAVNGLLPCGLVYAAAAAAVTTGNVLAGLGYMAVFGLGTLPMMLGIAMAGGRLQGIVRGRWQYAIPVCAGMVAGLLILRGLSLGIPYLSPELGGAVAAESCCH